MCSKLKQVVQGNTAMSFLIRFVMERTHEEKRQEWTLKLDEQRQRGSIHPNEKCALILEALKQAIYVVVVVSRVTN